MSIDIRFDLLYDRAAVGFVSGTRILLHPIRRKNADDYHLFDGVHSVEQRQFVLHAPVLPHKGFCVLWRTKTKSQEELMNSGAAVRNAILVALAVSALASAPRE